MDFRKLNSIAKLKRRTLRKISDLDLEVDYNIENIRKVATKYGEKVVVDLEENSCCYLPHRVSNELLSEDERGFQGFKEQLKESTVKLRRLDGQWNPIRFIVAGPQENVE